MLWDLHLSALDAHCDAVVFSTTKKQNMHISDKEPSAVPIQLVPEDRSLGLWNDVWE